MQDLRDKEKKQLQMTVSRPFWILFLQNSDHGVSLCSICMVQLFCFDVELRKYYKITRLLDSHLKKMLRKVIRSLTDIAVHICQIERKSAGNFFLECATSVSLLVALVIKGFIIWEIKMSPKIPCCYLMAMRSMRKQKFIDQLPCKISEIMRKKMKWLTGGHFGFYNCKICHGLSLCETLHFVLYSWSSYFAFFWVK